MKPNNDRRLIAPRGLTILELLVTVSIIGVLAALVLPAVHGARETARRAMCVNHLHQIGIAMHQHHNATNHLPAGWQFDSTNRSAFGWAVPLLPYLEQAALAETIDTKKTIDDVHHDLARSTSLAVMLCPSDITDATFTLHAEPTEDSPPIAAFASAPTTPLVELPTANYVGMFGTVEADDTIPAPMGDGTFLENRRTRFRDFQRGLSQTVVVGERTMAQVPSTWLGVSLAGEDAAFRIVGAALEGINQPFADEGDFSSRHPGGANFLWGDGHVSFVDQNIDLTQYHRSAQLRHRGGW